MSHDNYALRGGTLHIRQGPSPHHRFSSCAPPTPPSLCPARTHPSPNADFQSPGALIDFDVLAESVVCEEEASPEGSGVEVHNPRYDYIPPHLISLFVTDTGGYTPAYVYRLLAEYYSREDYSLESELIDRMKL